MHPARQVGRAPELDRDVPRDLRVEVRLLLHRELLLKLAETADVMVEAFRPGVVKRLGVDYEAVAARNPKIVYCSISAFGQDSSLAKKPAHDVAVQALAGLIDSYQSASLWTA